MTVSLSPLRLVEETLRLHLRFIPTGSKQVLNSSRQIKEKRLLLHSVPRTGSGSPTQSPGICGMATLHLDPVLSHSVYS